MRAQKTPTARPGPLGAAPRGARAPAERTENGRHVGSVRPRANPRLQRSEAALFGELEGIEAVLLAEALGAENRPNLGALSVGAAAAAVQNGGNAGVVASCSGPNPTHAPTNHHHATPPDRLAPVEAAVIALAERLASVEAAVLELALELARRGRNDG